MGEKGVKVSNNSSITDKNKSTSVRRTRLKPLAGNGIHKALGFVEGVLVEENSNYKLILTDGSTFPIRFVNLKIEKFVTSNKLCGKNLYLVYPKMKDEKIVVLDLLGWNPKVIPQGFNKEHWLFIGLWAPQKFLIVQRDFNNPNIQVQLKRDRFVKKYKFFFKNGFYLQKEGILSPGYVYSIKAKRKNDEFYIEKSKWIASPVKKPVTPPPKQLVYSFQK